MIRDRRELNGFTDYIHYNPAKHGLVRRPIDYPHSSIHDAAFEGVYDVDWGEVDIQFQGEYGE
jgi:putative transposase